jgi:hypothetical protein
VQLKVTGTRIEKFQETTKMTTLNLARFQHQWVRAVTRQSSALWVGFAITLTMLGYHLWSGKLFMFPLYGLIALVIMIISGHWKKTPKPVRLIALGSVLTIFTWLVMIEYAQPAHALFFNKLFDILTSATDSWNVKIPNVPKWLAEGLRAIGVVVVAGVVVRLLRSRDGEEDETSRVFGKFMKVLILLGLGDAMLSLFNI